jgi:hypothetical protein
MRAGQADVKPVLNQGPPGGRPGIRGYFDPGGQADAGRIAGRDGEKFRFVTGLEN